MVAAYFGVRREPPTTEFLDAAVARGLRVVLPILRSDGDLDWADYTGADDLAEGPLGLHEPTAPSLGVEAVTQADVVVAPALAVDRAGRRLGQGGGAYDRALRRVPAGVKIIAVVFDDEVVDSVPVELHDIVVSAAATPSGVITFDADPGTTNGPVPGG
jgi:5-formyltetrahydrofolate cyclo-ligase